MCFLLKMGIIHCYVSLPEGNSILKKWMEHTGFVSWKTHRQSWGFFPGFPVSFCRCALVKAGDVLFDYLHPHFSMVFLINILLGNRYNNVVVHKFNGSCEYAPVALDNIYIGIYYILYVYINNICTWNSNDPCFDWKGPFSGGLKPKNRGQMGSRYVYSI